MTPFYLNLLRLVAFLHIVAIAAGQQNTTDICQEVASRLPGRISYPADPVYISSRQSYYSGFERILAPGCIFRPINTAEVSQFIKLVTAGSQYRNTSQLPKFAVRGGGHTLFSGAANIDGGVTIDLREIKSLVLSQDRKVAAIGGGAVWSNIYPQLVPYNLTVMGGRVPGVGVGGFATGGGVNFLNQRHGWSCDNTYGYEVVLASGEIVYATADSYKDLWLSLKGGSNNFGIVTRFDVATFPQGLMWGGVIRFNYTKSVLDAQAQAFRNYMDPKNFDSAADMGIILGFANNTFSVANSLFYVDPVVNPKTYQAFTSIPSLSPNTLALTNVSNMVVQFGKNLPPTVPRSIQLVYSFRNSDVATYTKLIQQWETDIKTLGNIPGIISQFLIQPQPVTNGTNSLGLEANQHDVVMSIVTAAWSNAADDAVVQQRVAAIADKHERLVRKQRLYIPFKYLNYADISQDVIGSYGMNNKRRLRAVSRKYDPKGLFQTSVPGGFKVWK
ncbi:MAG: hypothetical protein L6R42_007718 [Xanthoria sp. 1 TBL-2021]|nr:MAG: hypothetical protein L6R42_007718 [Xanthoria sp. 1 TBL-2021]